MSDYVQVSTSAPTRDAAVKLAEGATTARLAAGAQVTGPVTSVFWHLGERGAGEEWQVLLFTTADRYPALESHLVDAHPWDNPQVTAVAVVHGSADYLAWIRRTVEAD
ncbi:divalent-cation tolerance protein CutA [Micromonospora sp. WMMD1120]|uniref:divalent-cation tolerance protein CutA n=1 Tax=Micromonospora sp. WMMD1120 TaxID=3016106 RepID=UPI0024171AAD|nr:divalent-cation tolerance protein CutA [Micromonospora sp. WMMD1120]MDG4810924.1 divalent-cation tolerance protein CutA [Micromonospora sp. WMMD1120]